MAEVKWGKLAQKDIKKIYEYISQDSEFYALRFIELLISRTDILTEIPLAGRMVPEKENESIRELIEGNYRIFYQVKPDMSIKILRVHH